MSRHCLLPCQLQRDGGVCECMLEQRAVGWKAVLERVRRDHDKVRETDEELGRRGGETCA